MHDTSTGSVIDDAQVVEIVWGIPWIIGPTVIISLSIIRCIP
jgi:hypothetical protein